MTFKVGDKVKHEIHGVGTVVYGPYTGRLSDKPLHLVEFSDGRSGGYSEQNLTALPAFAVNDRVTVEVFGPDPLTVAAGPFQSAERSSLYVLRDGNGNHLTTTERYMSPAESQSFEDQTFAEGDRVMVSRDARSAGGYPAEFSGYATVSYGPDTDGDYYVTSADGRHSAYVFPPYLRKR